MQEDPRPPASVGSVLLSDIYQLVEGFIYTVYMFMCVLCRENEHQAQLAKDALRNEILRMFKKKSPLSEDRDLDSSDMRKWNFEDGEAVTEALLKKLSVETHAQSPARFDFDPSSFKPVTLEAGKPTHVSNDTPAISPAQLFVGFHPGLSEAELEQARKRTIIRTKLQVKRDERLGRSTNIADVATTHALKQLLPVAEKYGVEDLVIHDEGTGAGDPLAADSRMQNVFERLPQARSIPTTWVDQLQNFLNAELPKYARSTKSVFCKLQKNWTMQFGGPGVQKNALVLFKLVFSMALFASIPAKVGAIAPEPTTEGWSTRDINDRLKTANSSSSFTFGLMGAIASIATVLILAIAIWNCYRRSSMTSPGRTARLNQGMEILSRDIERFNTLLQGDRFTGNTLDIVVQPHQEEEEVVVPRREG